MKFHKINGMSKVYIYAELCNKHVNGDQFRTQASVDLNFGNVKKL
jgi:hypothetical protein